MPPPIGNVKVPIMVDEVRVVRRPRWPGGSRRSRSRPAIVKEHRADGSRTAVGITALIAITAAVIIIGAIIAIMM